MYSRSVRRRRGNWVALSSPYIKCVTYKPHLLSYIIPALEHGLLQRVAWTPDGKGPSPTLGQLLMRAHPALGIDHLTRWPIVIWCWRLSTSRRPYFIGSTWHGIRRAAGNSVSAPRDSDVWRLVPQDSTTTIILSQRESRTVLQVTESVLSRYSHSGVGRRTPDKFGRNGSCPPQRDAKFAVSSSRVHSGGGFLENRDQYTPHNYSQKAHYFAKCLNSYHRTSQHKPVENGEKYQPMRVMYHLIMADKSNKARKGTHKFQFTCRKHRGSACRAYLLLTIAIRGPRGSDSCP